MKRSRPGCHLIELYGDQRVGIDAYVFPDGNVDLELNYCESTMRLSVKIHDLERVVMEGRRFMEKPAVSEKSP